MTSAVFPAPLANAPSRNAAVEPSRNRRGARWLLLVAIVAAGACSDAAVAPQASIDRVAAARVMPSVTDARVRLAGGIENEAIRERVTHDLTELARALTNGDGSKARFHTRVLGNVLTDYRSQQGGSMTDGQDVTAIALMLFSVAQVIDVQVVLPLP
ncbi:MAG: hypothetical protein WD801_14955 [Gemmatimonadaceae bacterium]